MNHFIVRENDTKNLSILSTEWPKEEIQQIGQWDIISQHESRIMAKQAIETSKNESLI